MEQYQETYFLDGEEPVFGGHFPGNPLFPGVMTLALMRETVRRASGRDWRLGAIARHKLLHPLVPGDVVSVSCRVEGGDEKTLVLDCRLALGDGTAVASARLHLEPV